MGVVVSTILSNTYCAPIKLFMVGDEVASSEGTTQGDQLPMAMYALAIKLLIDKLRVLEPSEKQVWFADDATAAGRLASLLSLPTVGTHNNWTVVWILPACGQNSPASETGSCQ